MQILPFVKILGKNMRLKIRHKIPQGQELVLPNSYHHILQSIIYTALDISPEFGQKLHNEGYKITNRSYKLFTFSEISGKYRISNGFIIFYEDVHFEVSSVDPYFIKTLKSGLLEKGITYGHHHFDKLMLEVSDDTIEESSIKIKMISPITVYATDIYTNETEYFSPKDSSFSEYINDNFKRKYEAYCETIPTSNIKIELLKDFTPKLKVITKYHDMYIEAWRGQYVLTGERKYLDFLYQVGLGAKNSQGFGMFEVLKNNN